MDQSQYKQVVLSQINNDEIIELATGLAQFQSFSDHERDCAMWVANYLRERDVEVTVQEVEPGRPNVIATIPGDGTGASLMFNGHLDVDPLTEGYKHDPWKIEVRDGKLWGHGLANMKAGVASMIHAALAVKRSQVRLKGSIVVACVIGELQCGVGSEHLSRNGPLTDLAIVPEPSNMNVRTTHSGNVIVLIRVRGTSGWIGAMHRYTTVNAVDKMANVIAALRELKFATPRDPLLPGVPRHLIGSIIGGLGGEGGEPNLSRPSYVPDNCMITLEVRMPPGMTMESAIVDIEKILDRVRATDSDLDVELLKPPAAYRRPWRSGPFVHPAMKLPLGHPLEGLVVSNYREIMGSDPLKVGAEDPGSYGCTDAGHLAQVGVKALVFGCTANLWGESFVELKNLFAHSRILAACAADVVSTERARWVGPLRPNQN